MDFRGPLITRREALLGAGLIVGGLALADIIAACTGGSPSIETSSAAKRGGNFRLGVTGGGARDIIDGQDLLTKPDQARLVAGFEPLLEYDDNYNLTSDGLAESVTQEQPDQWTIRLRQGIEWHNGKTLTADDVIYSIQRLLDPNVGLSRAAAFGSVDPNAMNKMDDRTVRLRLKSPDSTIGEELAQFYNAIVPVGYKRFPSEQIGTGPYKLKSFSPGQQSVHVRNPNYWRAGQPYFDQVAIIDFPDTSAQVNALLAGQVDAITDVPYAQVSAIRAHPELALLESYGGGWIPLCMAIDMEPFRDVRVRQAMRLIADGATMVTQVLSGHGRIANDLYAPLDPDYASDLPQRHQDLAQARSLLKAAGKESLTIDLHTTDAGAGMVDVANVFAQQANGAGVTVNVRQDANYYGDQYLKLAFSVDYWATRNYLPQVADSSIPTAVYNATHWPPADSNYLSLYDQALAAVDAIRRKELKHEMQMLEFEQGGYIIPFFHNLVDAYSMRVSGFKAGKGTLNLDSYGHGFRTIWFR
jgi:peptide/nickel transport system substrate-binding protein